MYLVTDTVLLYFNKMLFIILYIQYKLKTKKFVIIEKNDIKLCICFNFYIRVTLWEFLAAPTLWSRNT